MPHDRYLKLVLTVIALELLWLAVSQSRPVFAQPSAPAQTSAPAPMPVVITGIHLNPNDPILPVQVMGIVSTQTSGPVKVETDRPLLVTVTGGKPSRMPGE
jgi:hypothetical protein